MIRAHYTDNETGWVEPLGDGTARVLNVPWTTGDFGYLDIVQLRPSSECPEPTCTMPTVGDVLERSQLHSWVVDCHLWKRKNGRRLADALNRADPEIRFSNFIGSCEFRVATRLSAVELAQRLKLPFRVNILDFYPGKVG
jgi:hypothetical protein